MPSTSYHKSFSVIRWSFHIIFLATFIIIFINTSITRSATADDLKAKINSKSEDIKALELEIASYQKEIDSLSGKASTLASTIKSLELTQKKLAADIKVTESKIADKNSEISSLTKNISIHAENIVADRGIISSAFTKMRETGDASLIELLLGSESISGTFDSIDDLSNLQSGLSQRIAELSAMKTSLEQTKVKTEKAKKELEALNEQIKGQKAVVANTTAEQNKLLKDTKQSEAKYTELVASKTKLKEAFEREMSDLESQLKTAVDLSKLPKTGTGALMWPLDVVKITQYFGNTSFSTANPQIYKGGSHNGLDLRASIGTPVRAARSGTVIGMFNMDSIPSCYSYGKWIMIKHSNGLSTLYAHLSVFSTSIGANVNTGDVIGYSGNTGASTGPHLHFGVYASDAVTISTLTSSKNCRNALMPISPYQGYLNPLSYLPQ